MISPTYEILPLPSETEFWHYFGYVTGIARKDLSSMVGMHLVGRNLLLRDTVGDYLANALIKQVAMDYVNNRTLRDMSQPLPNHGLTIVRPSSLGSNDWSYFEPVEDPLFWYSLSQVLDISPVNLAAKVDLRMAAKDHVIADRVGSYFLFAVIERLESDLEPAPQVHPMGRRGLQIVGKPSPPC